MKDNNGPACLAHVSLARSTESRTQGRLVVHIQDCVLLHFFLFQVERKSSYKSGTLPARKGKRILNFIAWHGMQRVRVVRALNFRKYCFRPPAGVVQSVSRSRL